MRHTAPVHNGESTAFPNPWMMPFLAMNGCFPLMAGASSTSHQAYEGFSAISLEWQEFLTRRFKEDADLLGKIAGCRSIEEAWGAYADFWKKAADDYSREFAAIMKIAAGATTKAIAATRDG